MHVSLFLIPPVHIRSNMSAEIDQSEQNLKPRPHTVREGWAGYENSFQDHQCEFHILMQLSISIFEKYITKSG